MQQHEQGQGSRWSASHRICRQKWRGGGCVTGPPIKGWGAGNASQSTTGFQAFTGTRYFSNLSLQSSLKPKRSLTTQYLSRLAFSEATVPAHRNRVCWRKSGMKVLWSFTNRNKVGRNVCFLSFFLLFPREIKSSHPIDTKPECLTQNWLLYLWTKYKIAI